MTKKAMAEILLALQHAEYHARSLQQCDHCGAAASCIVDDIVTARKTVIIAAADEVTEEGNRE